MLFSVAMFFVGLAVLYFGAEYLVRGSSALAVSFGIRPLIVGMTIVSLATSMPELMVSLLAAWQGSSDIAVGNIVGSNVANIGLILGASALLAPLAVPRSLLKRELPFMIFVTVVLFVQSFDGYIGRGDGVVLLALLGLFMGYCIRYARSGGDANGADEVIVAGVSSRGRNAVYVIAGIVGLGLGAHWMVDSAVTIARAIGLSELFIGMTIVALGTSLPELAASLMSAAKGEMEISIGNVVGSNIFNIVFVLGVCPLIRPIAVEASVPKFELPFLLLFSVALLLLCGRGLRIGRGKGAFLLLGYVAFIAALFL